MNDKTSADYCLVSKTLIEDRLVSPKAKAMYAVLCWCPPGFDCSVNNLAEVLNIGNESASRLLKELKECGYIEREKNKKGKSYRVYPRSIYSEDEEV